MARRRTQVDRKAAKAEQRREVRTSSAEHPLLALQRSAGNSAVTESLLAREGAKAPPKKEEPKSGKDYTVTIEGVGEFKALSFSFRGENEVVVMKETDELTTELMRLAREGKSLKVVITAPHMTLTLEGTIISGYNVGSGRDKPVETLTFNYTTQSIKYHGDDDAGGASTDYP